MRSVPAAMKPRMIDWLVCPLWHEDLQLPDAAPPDLESGALTCTNGHSFPVVAGVPRLMPDVEAQAVDTESIRESFSHEWKHFDYERDRTWGTPVDQRREEFLRHVDLPADALAGKLVLDAGCGNGTLSRAIASLGC